MFACISVWFSSLFFVIKQNIYRKSGEVSKLKSTNQVLINKMSDKDLFERHKVDPRCGKSRYNDNYVLFLYPHLSVSAFYYVYNFKSKSVL